MLDDGNTCDDVDPADNNGLFNDAIGLLKVLSFSVSLSLFGCCLFLLLHSGTVPLQFPAQHIMTGLPTRSKPSLHLTWPEKKLGLARPDTCPFGTTGSSHESVQYIIIQYALLNNLLIKLPAYVRLNTRASKEIGNIFTL